jgi:hypothetical protein
MISKGSLWKKKKIAIMQLLDRVGLQHKQAILRTAFSWSILH